MTNYFILCIAILNCLSGNVKAICQDYIGRAVLEGMHYIPGPDTCTLCVCDDSVAKWCKAVLCSPPQNCKSFTVGSSCCEFNCLDESLNDNDQIDYKSDNINARSIASTITAILFFVLIVFLINRLHKRNIMSNGDANSPQMGEGVRGIGFISGYMNFQRPLDTDLFYGDHATLHIPLWKTYYPRGDAPPPYDVAIALPHTIPQQFIGLVDEVTSHRTIPVAMTDIEQNVQPQSCRLEVEPFANRSFLGEEIINNEHHSNGKVHCNTSRANDFREECANCKLEQELAEGYDDTFPEPETMTLERRPQITYEHPTFIEPRSSVTLPADGRLRKSHVSNMKDTNRDGWSKETSLKENSTSDDEQPL